MVKKPTYEELVQRVKELEGELKRVEEELEDREEQFQSLYDTAPLPYQALDENGCFLDVNSPWVEELGYSREEVLGQWFGDFLVPEYVDRFKEFFPRFKAAGEIYGVEFEMVRKGGSIILVSFNGKIAYDAEGRFKQTHCVFQNITALKRAEEALRQSEEKYKGIFNTVPTSIILIDKDGQMVDINPYHLTHIAKGKFPKKEFIGKNIVTHPTIVNAGLSETYKKVLEGEPFDKKDVYFPTLMPGGDGYFNVKGVPLQKNNKVIGALIMHEDITERKQAEEALRESEERYRRIVETANEGIWVIDAESSTTYVNAKMSHMLGYSQDEMIGRCLFEFMDEEARSIAEANLERRRRGITEQHDFKFRRKDGTDLWTIVSTNPFFDEDGCYAGALGMITDITDQRLMEEALHESEENFRELAENSPLGVVIADSKANHLYVNKRFAEITGYGIDELIGMTGFEVLTRPKDRRKYRERMKKRMKSEPHKKSYERVLLRKDGTDVLTEFFTTKTRWKGEMCPLAIVQDITSRKQAEEKIKASLNEKELLLQEIHHRVKNNMQVISSLLKLQAATLEEETLHAPFRDCEHRVRAMSLVHEKLYQSKDFTHVPFRDYLQSLIRYLYQSYTPKAGEIELVTEIEDLPLTITHAIPCGLITNELVSNALKHAFPDKKTGTITISLHSPEPHTYELTVSDDGIGLPEEIDLKTTKSLGLHLVTILVEDQLKGSIEVDRTRGTTFYIVFGTR